MEIHIPISVLYLMIGVFFATIAVAKAGGEIWRTCSAASPRFAVLVAALSVLYAVVAWPTMVKFEVDTESV